jgi:hypothetical protein
MFVKNARTNRNFTLIRWGNELYLPLREGDRPEVYVINGFRGMMVGLPSFLEGANVYGPEKTNQPEFCDTDSMWEARSGDHALIKGIHDPRTGKTRPVVIERTGQGLTIAEAIYQDPTLRGQWAFYERWQTGFGTPPSWRGWNDLYSVEPSVPSYWDQYPQTRTEEYYPSRDVGRGMTKGGPESFTRGPSQPFGTLGGFHEEASHDIGQSKSPMRSAGRAGAGLGDAENQTSYATGYNYNPTSAKLALLYFEFRRDLAEMLGWMNVPDETWSWGMPDLTRQWWLDLPWTFDPTGGIARQVPQAPHRPR